jgi:hypothetical protein
MADDPMAGSEGLDLPGYAGHLDRCFLGLEEKRARRVVADDRIGLAS